MPQKTVAQIHSLENLPEIPYQLIADNVLDMIWIVRFETVSGESADDPPGAPTPGSITIRFVYVTPSVERLLGYTPEEWLPKDLSECLTPESTQKCFDELHDIFEQEQQTGQLVTDRVLELEHICKDGKHIICEVTSVFIRDEQQRPIGALGITRDITPHKIAEAALRNEKRLLQQLLDLQERDRQILAYEIHDGLAQQMTAALMHFEASTGFSSEESLRSAVEHERGMKMLRESIQESRRLISGLRPPILDEYGIVSAVEYLANETRRFGLDVLFDPPAKLEGIARPLESAIFRIVQEGLTNARRYSKSDEVRVELSRQGSRIKVVIEDKGVGFDMDVVPADRFGLRGIRERARLLDGQATITSKAKRGTRIEVILPLIATEERPGELSETQGMPR